MKKIKHTQANGFYIFTGRSNANSCFIEKISHAKQFLIYGNYFLKGYLKIYDYVITRDEWILVVKIKSKKELIDRVGVDSEEVWRIISERMRLFLSTFVRVTNNQKGRTGCLVHSRYERMYFDSLDEAKVVIDKIRKQQIKFYNSRKKYRGLKIHYRIGVKLGAGSVFLCSKDRAEMKRKLGEVFDFIDLGRLVLQNMVTFTHSTHNQTQFPYSHPPNHPILT